jgi:predicted transposase YdaD
MQDYDVSLKMLLRDSARLTLRQIAGSPVTNWLNVELPKVQNPKLDLLGEVKGGSLVHIELQSTNDQRMPLRMMEYCAGIYRQHGRLPRQIMLYVGGAPLRMARELAGPDLRFRYNAIDIRDLDSAALLASSDFGDNVIAVLTRLQDNRDTVRAILKGIARLKQDEREIALQALMRLSGLRRLTHVVEEESRKVPVYIDPLKMPFIRHEFKRGLVEGKKEGLVEGEKKGIVEGELAIIRRLIQKRFGRIPVWAAKRLKSCSAEQLEELSERVLDAGSLKELLG